ncbi:MAG: hydroxymethylpyrimidine/phosphomethylpyrimidine kinase, partial [Phycisphaerae bacterium]|nr:hydroxymethylpyrimidine/phosphomethylpyrimidine kinase [Phycisphaerae bacterium]NIP50550.1 hydroxymethylpyrimidine/phosphomethylpyrimidine kinase [Phycisphaerae bacterium]NIW46226.1 hydroxymethylpyrimidine/phosphomethylpyrimidine kinase [Gammaproteobacteria bacterium]NIX26261.1 hydroxymethylpyrimidine/phosphomethylpyrimidine kinase [Phycisphaerae bacterium]
RAYLENLLPLATLVTPNRWEAELLTGKSIASLEDMVSAARHLADTGVENVL